MIDKQIHRWIKRTHKLNRPVRTPISAGNVPVSWLFCSPSVVRFVKLLKVRGIVPSKLLSPSPSTRNDVMPPILEGIVPVSPFTARSL